MRLVPGSMKNNVDENLWKQQRSRFNVIGRDAEGCSPPLLLFHLKTAESIASISEDSNCIMIFVIPRLHDRTIINSNRNRKSRMRNNDSNSNINKS